MVSALHNCSDTQKRKYSLMREKYSSQTSLSKSGRRNIDEACYSQCLKASHSGEVLNVQSKQGIVKQ